MIFLNLLLTLINIGVLYIQFKRPLTVQLPAQPVPVKVTHSPGEPAHCSQCGHHVNRYTSLADGQVICANCRPLEIK